MSDRKYRHRGYMDGGGSSSDRDRSSSQPSAPRPEPPRPRIEGAPRGRTAGGPGPEVFKCNRCGVVQTALGELEPDALCGCGADLHTCSNCRFFDTSTQWECRQMIPARVAPKDKKNECTFFAPKVIRDLAADKGKMASAGASTPDDARKLFESLFKK